MTHHGDARRTPTDDGPPPGEITYELTDTERPSHAVVRAVAAVIGVPPLALRPLGEVVDPEAVDRLFSPSKNSTTPGSVLGFEYEGCSVSVHADGRVVVGPPDDEEA